MNLRILGACALGLALASSAYAQPDLSVSIQGPSPIQGTSGSSFAVGFTVANTGISNAASFTVRARVPSGARIDDFAGPLALRHHRSAVGTRTITFTASPGLLHGQTWSVPLNLRILNEGTTGVFAVEIIAQSPADFDSTPNDGMGDDYASTPVMGTPLPALPLGYQVQAVAFGRLGTPYAAVYQRGVYRYLNGSWQPINAGLGNLNVWDVDAVNGPGGTDVLVAATIGGGLYRFDPVTQTWSARPTGLVNARGVVTFGNNSLFATGDLATGEGAVYRSDDDGMTWRMLGLVGTGAVEPWSIALGPVQPTGAPILYVGTRRGLFKSTDGGATFLATGFFGNKADAFDVVAIGDLVIVGTRDGIRRSVDAGATFGPLVKTTPAADRSRNVYDLEYRPAQGALPARLYVSHWGRPGVVVSTDFGMTFFDIPLLAPPDRFVERVFVNEQGTFFLALEGGGLQVTVPAEATARDDDRAASALGFDVSGSNPFSGRTAVRVSLAASAMVHVEVFDLLGRSVAVVADQTVEAGSHAFAVDLAGQPGGVYLVRATVGGETRSLRLVSLR